MKTALVTGSTDGIGLETAHQLLATGMHVLVHGRSEAKAARHEARQCGIAAVGEPNAVPRRIVILAPPHKRV